MRYEALARAHALAGDGEAEQWKSKARDAGDAIADAEDREHFDEDSATRTQSQYLAPQALRVLCDVIVTKRAVRPQTGLDRFRSPSRLRDGVRPASASSCSKRSCWSARTGRSARG